MIIFQALDWNKKWQIAHFCYDIASLELSNEQTWSLEGSY